MSHCRALADSCNPCKVSTCRVNMRHCNASACLIPMVGTMLASAASRELDIQVSGCAHMSAEV